MAGHTRGVLERSHHQQHETIRQNIVRYGEELPRMSSGVGCDSTAQGNKVTSYSEPSISYILICGWGQMTNSRNKAIPSSTYVPVRIYPTIPWQVNIWSGSFQYAQNIHDHVSLSSPIKGIERNILKLLPVSEVLYSNDITYILSYICSSA